MPINILFSIRVDFKKKEKKTQLPIAKITLKNYFLNETEKVCIYIYIGNTCKPIAKNRMKKIIYRPKQLY